MKGRKLQIQRKRKRYGKNIYDVFTDTEADRDYLRIVSGMGWPYADRAGFVVLLGEDLEQDFSLPHNPRHFRVLAEHTTGDMEELHRVCLELKTEFQVDHILADVDSPLLKIWQKITEASDGSVPLRSPQGCDDIDVNFVGQLIKKNTAGQKTLHFGTNSALPSHLSSLAVDAVEKANIKHRPEIAALGYALSKLEMTEPSRVIECTPPMVTSAFSL